MKPLEFACILKVSKSQLMESGFKDTVVEEVYAGIITYLAHHSNRQAPGIVAQIATIFFRSLEAGAAEPGLF